MDATKTSKIADPDLLVWVAIQLMIEQTDHITPGLGLESHTDLHNYFRRLIAPRQQRLMLQSGTVSPLTRRVHRVNFFS